MSEAKLSQRAQKILSFLSPSPLGGEGFRVRFLRQQTLAEQFGCSRRSIGRALNELKAAGLLIDLNKRHENRCKLYTVIPANAGIQTSPEPTLDASLRWHDKFTPQGLRQLELYRSTFEINFRAWPDWEEYYAQVTWELRDETDVHRLWRQTFDKLYVIQREVQMA